MKKSRIIGYKSPYSLFDGKVEAGTLYVPTNSTRRYYNPQGVGSYHLPPEIVERWKPVYEIKAKDWLYYTPTGIICRVSRNILDTDVTIPSYMTDGTPITPFYHNVRLATETEIKDGLIKEAHKRGFKYGISFHLIRTTVDDDFTICKEVNKDILTSLNSGTVGNYFYYDIDSDTLFTHGKGLYVIYEKGGWAQLKPNELTPVKVFLSCDGGSFEVEVSKKGIYYKPEGTWINVDDLRKAVDVITVRRVTSLELGIMPGIYTFTPVVIHSGCKRNVPVAEWGRVLTIYDELNRK